MKPQDKTQHFLMIARRHACSITAALLTFMALGCSEFSAYQSHLVPQARYTTAHSFNANEISKIAVIAQSVNTQRPAFLQFSVAEQLPTEQIVEQEFAFALIDKGYTVVTRRDVQDLLKEIHFQHSGLTDTDASELGKMLNVPAVLIVNVTQLQSRNMPVPYNAYNPYMMYQGNRTLISVSIAARLISVERAEVLWVGSYGDRYGSDMNDSIAKVAKTVAYALPDRRTPVAR